MTVSSVGRHPFVMRKLVNSYGPHHKIHVSWTHQHATSLVYSPSTFVPRASVIGRCEASTAIRLWKKHITTGKQLVPTFLFDSRAMILSVLSSWPLSSAYDDHVIEQRLTKVKMADSAFLVLFSPTRRRGRSQLTREKLILARVSFELRYILNSLRHVGRGALQDADTRKRSS